MKTISRYIMTLALLLTAVTGAWAQSTLNVVELVPPATWANDNSNVTAADLPGFKAVTLDEAKKWTGAPATGNAILIYAFDDKVNLVNFPNGVLGSNGKASFTKDIISGMNAKFYYTAEPADEPADEPAEPTLDFKWDSATKTGTFTMPAFDVEIAPIYAPKAVFATDGNLVLIPTAIEGVFAESTDAIVTPGKVANIGDTENPQGTVMYAVTSTNQATAPALTAFSADVPTAKNITVGSEVLVWYYIKGVDTPEGEEATAENTFNDSEICATPITVTVLSNKFDIEFKAANDNTIETGKATVTVDGTAATVTEGKLEGVKMGTEVKVTAKEGYKFRKVEAKKGAAAKPLANATTEDLGKVVCAAGHLHDAKTAVPSRCTAVGILGKVTTTGHGLILALSDATSQTWNTINGWTSVTTYAGTTLKVLPDDAARGANLTSYTTLGETTVSNWAVAQKSDYEAIFTNLGSTTGDSDGTTYDGNVNAYITTGVGGTAITDVYWSATYRQGNICWSFDSISWGNYNKTDGLRVRPVLGF